MLSVRPKGLLRGILALAVVVVAGSARADLIDPNYTMVFSVAACDEEGTCGTPTPIGGVAGPHDEEGGDTGYYHLDDVTLGGVAFIDYWNSSYDVDPFVTNNFAVTNISGVTQIFDIIVTSPVVVTGPQTLMSGSIGLTVTGTPPAGAATLTDTGVAVYQAQIDGGTVQTLFNPAYSLSCASPPVCSNSDNAMFTNIVGPQANANIGIRIRFTLSPGDSASGTSVFNIEAVPEPVTALMLGMGLVGLAIAGSRHRA
jgi:hypothetical protein